MGKAIVLTDQDFSQKNLGQVTFTVTNEEKASQIATAYCETIGDNTLYDSIYAFTLGLLEAGLWGKMKAVYPMYGDTLAKLRTNLVAPGTNDLIVGGNASAGADEQSIEFVRTIGTGDVGTPSSPISGRYIFLALGFKCNNLGSSTTTNKWYNARKADGTTADLLAVQATSANVTVNLGRGSSSYSFNFANPAMYQDNLICFAIDRNTGDYSFYHNGTLVNSGTLPDVTANANIVVNNILGQEYWDAKETESGATIEKNTNLADGHAFFFALGEIEPSNLATADQAIIDGILTDKNITPGT